MQMVTLLKNFCFDTPGLITTQPFSATLFHKRVTTVACLSRTRILHPCSLTPPLPCAFSPSAHRSPSLRSLSIFSVLIFPCRSNEGGILYLVEINRCTCMPISYAELGCKVPRPPSVCTSFACRPMSYRFLKPYSLAGATRAASSISSVTRTCSGAASYIGTCTARACP